MSIGPASKLPAFLSLLLAAAVGLVPASASAETLEIGIGTQNTTTNTVTGGVVLKELGLLEKHLPKTGKYKDIQYKLSWQNATSGPPITNGMMANNIQIGMSNAVGGGNGIVVHKDSPVLRTRRSQGQERVRAVRFGSSRHDADVAAEEGAAAGFLESRFTVAGSR